MTKYDNPDKLIMDHIIRPYQNWLDKDWHGKRLIKNPFTHVELIEKLETKSKWSDAVLKRLKACDVKINKWINHPVTNYLKENKIIK